MSAEMKPWQRLAVVGSLLGALAAVVAFLTQRPQRVAVSPAVSAVAPSSSAATPELIDPLRPDAPLRRDPARAALPQDWASARPGFQRSLSAAQRGGIEPCSTQPVDGSSLEDAVPLGTGKLSIPQSLAESSDATFDLIIHLHGEEPVRRELIESGQQLVLFTLTLGPSESYGPLLTGAASYQAIRAQVEQALSQRLGRELRARKIALSAWSAGFVGVAAAVSNDAGRGADAVILIDGLHAPRNDRNLFEAQLAPFLEYARLAASGQRFMFISHSSIDPPGFASTTECAHYLIQRLGGQPEAVERRDRFGLELVELFSRSELHVRGYAGNDKPDHCAQLALLRDVYRTLGSRWATP